MSAQYDLYLQQHKNNVYKGFEWIQQNLPELLIDGVGWQTEFAHDASKSEPDEYEAYDAYYYGGNRSYQVVQDYNRAWLLHLHRNPHHWQYWVLINDDPKEGEIILDMPDNYILEMICDWWAFSWAKGNLEEIFGWYDEHKDYMKLSDRTRKSVELILSKIKEKLSDEEQLAHHGVKGQKWGVRRTPEQLGNDKKVAKVLNTGKIKMSEDKFLNYALDSEKAPNKAKAFKEALGYTKENYKELIDNINSHLDRDKFVEKGDGGYGMRFENVTRLKGPNGKEANVLTAWIQGDDGKRLTSVYVTKKEETK